MLVDYFMKKDTADQKAQEEAMAEKKWQLEVDADLQKQRLRLEEERLKADARQRQAENEQKQQQHDMMLEMMRQNMQMCQAFLNKLGSS